jgi:hypothetical protein
LELLGHMISVTGWAPTLWTQVLNRSVNRLISLAKMVGFQLN